MTLKKLNEIALIYLCMLNKIADTPTTWYKDDSDKIYIYFTYEEIQQKYNCKQTKSWQILRHLKDVGLITVKQQGFGFPQKVYPLHADVVETLCKKIQRKGEYIVPEKKQLWILKCIIKQIAPSKEDEWMCSLILNNCVRFLSLEEAERDFYLNIFFR